MLSPMNINQFTLINSNPPCNKKERVIIYHQSTTNNDLNLVTTQKEIYIQEIIEVTYTDSVFSSNYKDL